jgi:nucleotide-binding universal stress UspA family protein
MSLPGVTQITALAFNSKYLDRGRWSPPAGVSCLVPQKYAHPSIKNILFATDFSPSSQAALPFLHAIAMRHGATVHLVHVIAPEARTLVPMDRVPELDGDQIDAESAMEAMQASDAFHDIPQTATVERGEVWEVLASMLEEKKHRSDRGRHAWTALAQENGARLNRGTGFPPRSLPGAHRRPADYQRGDGAGQRLRPFFWQPIFPPAPSTPCLMRCRWREPTIHASSCCMPCRLSASAGRPGCHERQ